MEREACVCDHGYERSDLCAEIIIIIIISTVNIIVICVCCRGRCTTAVACMYVVYNEHVQYHLTGD